MNLHAAAEAVRKQGRNGDTMLVHMHPNEVAGLDALARWNGGKLTINPKTGQPEAFFLAALLPALVGAAGTAAGVSPWLMAGGTALAGTLATGSLSKGLMMGLGAFGGAGLAGGVANAGLKSLSGVGTAGAEAAGTAAAAQAAARTANAASGAFPSANTLSTASNAARTTGNMAADMSQRVGQGVLTAPQAPTMAQNFSNMGQGLKTMVQNPSHFVERSGGPMNLAMNTGMAAAPFLDPSRMQRKMPGQGKEDDMNFPRLSDDFFARPIYSGEPMPITYPERQFSAGGITSLGMYSDGGQTVIGPGDGMSDTVPATIGGVQPARLSTEEFVVPADVVSHLGNGSSSAGAAKLYSMMDRVREARTGQEGQAPQINSERMMPV